MNLEEIENMGNIPLFEPIYPEWEPSRQMRKMERKTGRRRTREDVLRYMEKYNEKPLPICLDCDKTCIQRQVIGLTYFECNEKNQIK